MTDTAIVDVIWNGFHQAKKIADLAERYGAYMVLAVGILVDDAIVVVENVERIMAEEGLPPKEATRKAMSQITSAIIGITLVLMAVFVPMAFFPGSVGIR